MRFRQYLTVFVLVLGLHRFALAQDYFDSEVENYTISATRVKTRTSSVGSSVTVISGEEMERKKAISVQEVLSGLPGVDVIRSGGKGGNTSISLRGANFEHTLVVIDGVEVNDPSSPNRAFNFGDLTLDNIERIEVLRGAQSTLYGSDALGGVILITTKRGIGEPSANVSFEGGSYETFNEKIAAQGASDWGHYSVAASRQDSGAISSAGSRYGNAEHDTYANTTVSARIGLVASEELSFNIIGRHHDARTQLDNSGGIGGDDVDRQLLNQESMFRAEAISTLLGKDLQETLGVSLSDSAREDNGNPDSLSPEFLRSDYDGSLIKIDFQERITTIEDHTLLAGAEWEEESASSNYLSDGVLGPFAAYFPEREARTKGLYLQDHFKISDQLSTVAGVRVDDHSDFGSEMTWRVAPALAVFGGDTTLRSSIGTGFKAPSLFQLFSSYGNSDLEAEESISVDGGIEQRLWQDQASAGVTYFWNKFDNLITFEPNTFIFENISEAETSGIEAFARLSLEESLDIHLNYTLTDTEDRDSGEELLRRPRHKVSATLNFSSCDCSNFNLSVVYVGDRDDTDFTTFPAKRVELGGYAVVNGSASYRASDNLELFARVENLFDKEYEDVLGFGTGGFAAYAGVKVDI